MTKTRIKILFIIIVVLSLLFSALYLYLVLQGKSIIIRQLEAATHKKVSIDSFELSPSLNLAIKKLEISGLLKADSIYITPSILGLLTGNLALNNLQMVKPQFIYERTNPALTDAAASITAPLVSPSLPTAAARPRKKRPLRLIIKRLNIKDGRLDFIDRSAGEEGIKLIVKDINFNLNNLYILPHSVITNFQLRGKIPWQQAAQEGSIEAEGWINLFKKDMQATLNIKDIDGIYLYPYYSKWVDLEKARIERAKLDFTSNITGLNNDITANCHLELKDIVFKPRAPEEQEEKAEKIAAAVLDIFKALNQGKIVLDFTFKTKMDKPIFGVGDIKMAVEDKLAKATKADELNIEAILRLPVKILEGTVKGATDLSKAVIDGTFSIGKVFKEAVEGSFKKEKKE